MMEICAQSNTQQMEGAPLTKKKLKRPSLAPQLFA